MKVGVVTFPGSLDDVDAQRAVRFGGHEAVALWHGDHDLRGVDAVILPGGFSYGDYLRCGAISRFSPVMTEVIAAANAGMPVLGICNGFQILCESHLLPGALIRNDHRKFVCKDQRLRIENNRTPWTSAYEADAEVTIVLKNGEGGFVADVETLDRLEGEGQVVARYLVDNPNGSLRDIAGITNERGNVVGLMPHPEHAVEDLTGAGTDGLRLLHVPGRVGPLLAIVYRSPRASARPGLRAGHAGALQIVPGLVGTDGPVGEPVEDAAHGQSGRVVRRVERALEATYVAAGRADLQHGVDARWRTASPSCAGSRRSWTLQTPLAFQVSDRLDQLRRVRALEVAGVGGLLAEQALQRRDHPLARPLLRHWAARAGGSP